ncbi:MAG TPA: MarC family protein [Candidatus Nanoarchaeia archaeon]|nr:MarC family protein [Candidatus Nanoarchaeia archaeon]
MLALVQLTILFFVLFDPPLSLVVFVAGTEHMVWAEKRKAAILAVLIAGLVSFSALIWGQQLLGLFNTNINNFKVAGGIILTILGIKMALGYPILPIDGSKKERSAQAIAALIGTPLLTGPAVITSSIVLRYEYGFVLTATAILIVLAATALMFLQADRVHAFLGKGVTRVISTFLGLITISWGIGFLRDALAF